MEAGVHAGMADEAGSDAVSASDDSYAKTSYDRPLKNDWDTIQSKMFSRRTADSALFTKMIDTKNRYHAELVMPIRDAAEEPEMPQLAPQLVHDGIENTAMRAGMALPQIAVPALEPGKETGVRSQEYAAIRRRALYAGWDFSLWQLLQFRAYRQLAGYGTFAAVVVPDFAHQRARIELRDALTAYPELRNPGDMRPPIDAGFVYGRSQAFLDNNYPEAAALIGPHPDSDGMWDLVEWIDEDSIVIGVLGPRSMNGWDSHDVTAGSSNSIELKRWRNRAECVPVAAPRRVTLDRIAGQMEAMTGAADWLDRLMALNVLAAEKNIFPDMYVLSDERDEAEIIGGEWQDGRTGQVNLLRGARAVGQLVSTTGPMTQSVINQLERAGRASGGASALAGGENPGSLRTGRAIDTLGSFSVDPRVKELQDIMSACLARSINPAIMEVEKGYWPDKKYVVFSGWSGDPGHVEYQPSKHFETTENTVNYAFPGTDISQVSVSVLQLVGGELMSKRTGRVKHPMVDDADAEGRQILRERMDAGVLASLEQQIVSGQLPVIDAAAIRKNLDKGLSLEDAIIDADEKARQRQASMAPPPNEEAGEMVPPGAQPGLAMPGQGAEMLQQRPEGAPSIGAPPAGQQNLRDLLRAVKTR
jgi:hypothetical protein